MAAHPERDADLVTVTTATRRKARLPPPVEAVDVQLVCKLSLMALVSQIHHQASSQRELHQRMKATLGSLGDHS